jgi:uncharacterized protein YcbX
MNARISELGLNPGKSMRAYEDVEALHFDQDGLFGDREYMWVEGEPYTYVNYKAGRQVGSGCFLSQREDPALACIIPVVSPEGLRLSYQEEDEIIVPRAEDTAANRRPVSVFKWSGEAVDQGDAAAEWGYKYIRRPVRLVAVSREKPRFVEGDPALGRVGFADVYPIHLTSTKASDTVNEYLASIGRPTVPADRYRANIILDIDDGEHDFPEDYITEVRIAQRGLTMVLRRWKACGRCPVPDTNQITGIRRRRTHVRSTLGKLGRNGTHVDKERFGYKEEVFLGQNMLIELPGHMEPDQTITVERGAEVEVVYSDSTNWVPSKIAA